MRYLTWKEIVALGLCPYSRQHFCRLGRLGRAPLRRKRGNRVVWVYDEVVQWQATFLPVVGSV